MRRLLLVEDVFLLGHDDESGKNTASLGLQGALAAALLLDLAERELIAVGDDGVEATGATTDEALLTRAVGVIGEEEKTRTVAHWLHNLPRALKPFERTVGEALVARGVLGEQEGKVLGLFSTTRWPERDPAPERELRAELHDALVDGAEPTVRVLLLCGVLVPYGMLDRLIEKADRRTARARAEELAKRAESGDAISAAIGDTVRAAQVAMMTAIMVSATTSAVTIAGSN